MALNMERELGMAKITKKGREWGIRLKSPTKTI
jgi:hypothetical protein